MSTEITAKRNPIRNSQKTAMRLGFTYEYKICESKSTNSSDIFRQKRKRKIKKKNTFKMKQYSECREKLMNYNRL